MTEQSNIEIAQSALSCIPPNDRETWLKMGMAVKDGCGEAGFQVWDSWSQRSASYDPGAAKDSWKSFKVGAASNGGRPIGFGTLIHEAKIRGYKPNGEFKPHQPTPSLSKLTTD